MPKQTGYIDLSATNSVMLAAEAGWSSDLEDYATKSDLTVSANNIKSEVSETYATKTEVQRTDTGSGTVVSSDDAANLPPLSLTVHGKSVQDGTPSPSSPVEIQSVEPCNLLDILSNPYRVDNCTYTVSGYSVTVVAATANSWPQVIWEVPLSGTAVTFSVGGMTAGGQAIMQLVDAGGSVLATSSTMKMAGSTSLTNANAARARVFLYARTTSAGSIGDTATFSNVMLQDGAVVHRFAPYGAIPISVSGKNLLNTSITEATYASVTYTQGNSGEIVLNGKKYGGGYAIVKQDAFSLQAGTYTFSAELVSGTATSSPTIYLLGNNDTVVFQVTVPAGSKKSHTVTLAEDTNIIKLRFGLFTDNSVYTNATYALQLEYGSEATEYEPYTDASAFIPLQGHALRSLPDGTEDTLEVDGEGNVTLTKRVGAATINGSEGFAWILGTTQLGAKTVAFTTKASWAAKFDALANVAATAKDNVICDRLPANNDAYNLWDGPAIQVWVDDSAAFMICVGQSFSTSADFNTWLQSNPLTVYYPLATPQTISLGRIDLPSLPSPSFSMHVDALVTPTLDAEWWTQGGEEVGSVYQRTSALEQDVDGITLELSEKVDSSEEWVSWLHAGTDATTHEPYLAMGKNSAYPSVVYGSDAARFYDGEGDDASNVVASFGADGARIGRIGEAHQTQTSTQSLVYGPDGKLVMVMRYQPYMASSGNRKYGTRITDANNMSFIVINPATSSGEFIDRLSLRANMNDIHLLTTSGSELHLDNTYASIEAKEAVSGTTYDNGLGLGFDSQNGYAPKVTISGTGAQAAWLTALGMDVETIQNDSMWTILRYGHVVMVQCHGYQGAANASTAKIAGVLANYKPQYNVSATISTSAGTSTQVARLCVYASDGGVYLAPAGYTGSATWYGTLTYIY